MSDTPSLENCKQLYELSGWSDCYWWHVVDPETMGDAEHQILDKEDAMSFGMGTIAQPAYDAGYLLRKLPQNLMISRMSNGDWAARSGGHAKVTVTPEDALAKLAIELFKEGILPISKDGHATTS